MLEEASRLLQFLFGPQPSNDEPNAFQAALRTALLYAATLVIVRLGNVRFLGKATAFDVVVGIMLGSIMSRAANGNAPLLPTLAAGAVLIAMHWIFARVAYHTDWFGPAIKGDRILLIKNGEIQRDGVERTSITRNDLTEALRLQTGQTNPSRIKLAYLERSGEISVIPYRRERRPPPSERRDRSGAARKRSSRERDRSEDEQHL